MNSYAKNTILTVSLATALLGLIGWRVYASKAKSVPEYEIVKDRSGSHPDGCSPLLGLAEEIVRDEPASSNSQLTVLITGDGTTANEPSQLAKYSIPRTRRAIEGRSASVRAQQDLLADLAQRCKAVHSASTSPIFLAISEAVADLRAQGCNEKSGCKLYIDSDGQENVDRQIRELLSRSREERPLLPSPIDNRGIHVMLCGLAVTTGGVVDSPHTTHGATGSEREQDRLQDVWRSLFAEAGLVRFAPYCPTPHLTGPKG
jgi:hypothetical protein